MLFNNKSINLLSFWLNMVLSGIKGTLRGFIWTNVCVYLKAVQVGVDIKTACRYMIWYLKVGGEFIAKPSEEKSIYNS